MTKVKIGLVVLLIPILIGVIGCKKKSNVITIRYFRWADPSEIEATREVIRLFEAQHPNIKVKLEFAPWSEYWNKLQAQIAAGETPDVFMISGFYFNDFARKGVLMNLTPFVEESGIDLSDFYEIPLKVLSYKDSLYALPRDYNVVVLYYNKKLFDKAGVPYPDTTWTWTDLRKAAKQLTKDLDGDGHIDQFGFLVINDMEMCWGNFVMQNGGQILNETKTKCLLDSPEAVEALKYLWNFMFVDSSAPTSAQLTAQTDPFLTGRVAMRVGGSWNLRRYHVPEVDYGITILPKGKVRAAFANGTGNAISANTKHPKEAWEFVKFFSSYEAQLKLAETGTSIPALKSVATSDRYREIVKSFGVDVDVFLKSLQFARPLPFTQHYSEWIDLVTRELERAWIGQVPMEVAARRAAEGATEILQRSIEE